MLDNFLIQDLVPNLPPVNLRDYAFYAIFIITLIRLYIILSAYLKLRKILPEKKQIMALKLIGQLEIPGLKRYIFTQIVLIIFPPIIAMIGLYSFGLDNLEWSDFSSWISFSGGLGLLIWIFYEINSIEKTGKELNSIINNFEEFLLKSQEYIDKYSGIIPEIINPISKNIGKDPETYIQLLNNLIILRGYTRSTSKWLRKKSPRLLKQNIFPFLGEIGKSVTQFIQYVVEVPQSLVEDAVAGVSDLLTKKINDELAKLFPITQTSLSEAIKTILKSAAPTIWLCLLVLLHDYSF